MPVLPPVPDVLDEPLRRIDHLAVRRHGQPPRRERVVGLRLAFGLEPDPLAETVAGEPQRPAARDLRILLPQRPGRGVARVGERRLPHLHELGVELGELLDAEVHLTAHLHQLRDRELVAGAQPLGHLLQRADVERDVLPRPAVASGEGPGELAVLVQQVDGEPVHLELAEVLGAAADLALDPVEPRPEFVEVERVVEAQHAFEVVVGVELRGERATDLLGGRIG